MNGPDSAEGFFVSVTFLFIKDFSLAPANIISSQVLNSLKHRIMESLVFQCYTSGFVQSSRCRCVWLASNLNITQWLCRTSWRCIRPQLRSRATLQKHLSRKYKPAHWNPAHPPSLLKAASSHRATQTELCRKQVHRDSSEYTASLKPMLAHVTLLETSYSTCFRKRPFFSGMSSTCTLSLLNSSCKVWGSSSGFPGGACIRNCSGSRVSFTGGFAKSERQKGIKQAVQQISRWYSKRETSSIPFPLSEFPQWCNTTTRALEPLLPQEALLLPTRWRPRCLPLHYTQKHHQLYRVRKPSLLSRRITGQIHAVIQLGGLCFLSVQLPPQQDLPKWMKPWLSTFGSCLEQIVEVKKMCYFTALQKVITFIAHAITKERDTLFDIAILNCMTVCWSVHDLQ